MTSTPAAAENSFATPIGIVKSRPRNEIWVASSLTRTTISRTSKTPRLRRSLLPMSPQSACVWRRPDRTVQLFRLPRSPLCWGGRRWGLRSPAAVVSSSGGVKDSWPSARPRRRRSKSPADASRSKSTTPSARSWKFPVSKMKHYLTWWANSMQSRAIPCGRLECCEIDQQTTKRQCVRLQALLTVSRGCWAERRTSAPTYDAVRWGNRPGKSPAASLKALYRYASNAPGARNGRYTDPMLEGQVGNCLARRSSSSEFDPCSMSQRTRPSDPFDRCVSSSRSARGTAVNPSYPRPWANRITRWRANPGSLGKIGHR
jgi:hypothetical protein